MRNAIVAGLAGALLGAGLAAWGTGAFDREAKAAPCWGGLGDETLKGLFGDARIHVEEQRLMRGRGEAVLGTCRITEQGKYFYEDQLTVRVHRLDGLRGTDAHDWPAEFLNPFMAPLGKDLPGMASTTRAWLALSPRCTGELRSDGPVVVDLAMGPANFDDDWVGEDDDARRAAMGRAVVGTATTVLRSLGCSTPLPAPPATLPGTVEENRAADEPLCGVKGLHLPASYAKKPPPGGWEPFSRHRRSGDDALVRVCDADRGHGPRLRLTTVTHPGLVNLFTASALRGGARVSGADRKGFGAVNAARAAYRAACPSGEVLFMVEQSDNVQGHPYDLTAALLPGYAAAEAERLGCGPLRIRPGPED
ncbi:hypothetical protein [Streptomyces roseolus]|uniref:hypothetical protein n=1 Tax=Streptomyces roseolus TaxID=67358 RepID=UPI001674C65B|nr:hypothetical protein [Streptomyces roseolus]GGR15318.1 hypothetical protein GCM10010282_04490 [Streptomyces roseolus]